MTDSWNDRPTGESTSNPYAQQAPHGTQNPYGSQPSAGQDIQHGQYAPYNPGTPAGQVQPGYPQDPYAANPYPQGGYTPQGYGQSPQGYGQSGYAQDPYAQPGYGQPAYGRDPYAQPGYGQPGYGPSTYDQDPYAQPGYGQPYSSVHGEQPYGAMTDYGRTPAPMRPSVGFVQAFRAFFQNYARFNGRASRSEFWWVQLALAIISFVLSFAVGLSEPVGGGTSGLTDALSALVSLWNLAVLVPWLAIGSRRLHDANHSAWWLLLLPLVIVGWVVLLVLLCGPSRPEGARFDADTQPATGAGHDRAGS